MARSTGPTTVWGGEYGGGLAASRFNLYTCLKSGRVCWDVKHHTEEVYGKVPLCQAFNIRHNIIEQLVQPVVDVMSQIL